MKKQILSEEFKRMQQLAGVLNENENENNEFSKLLNDLNTDLKAYDGEEITYEDSPKSMEIGVTIYPGYRKQEIQKSIKNIVKKNSLFMIDKESIEQYRDEEGIMTLFDIVKK